MRFFGYGAISDIWESTLEDLRGIVPGWFGPETVTIDVSDSRSAPQELQEAMAGVPPGATVVLSARAQKALIATLGDDMSELDRLFAESATMPADIGERVRSVVVARQAQVENMINAVVRSQEAAYRAGVPAAVMDEEETARLLAWPAVVIIGVAIVAACALAGYIVHDIVQHKEDTKLVGSALDEAIAAGNWEIVPQILGAAVKPPKAFPWGYVVGGTVVAALGIAGFFFIGEYAKEKGKRAGAGE